MGWLLAMLVIGGLLESGDLNYLICGGREHSPKHLMVVAGGGANI
jgi:hypothetical protein